MIGNYTFGGGFPICSGEAYIDMKKTDPSQINRVSLF